MPSLITISGRAFQWQRVVGATEFEALLRPFGPDQIDVLRIASSTSGFDAAIRIDSGSYSDGTKHGIERRWLGPLLVLGQCFPNDQDPVPPGFLIQLRPKLAMLKNDEPNASTVERIVQWCTSPRFRAVRINAVGGLWVGYGG